MKALLLFTLVFGFASARDINFDRRLKVIDIAHYETGKKLCKTINSLRLKSENGKRFKCKASELNVYGAVAVLSKVSNNDLIADQALNSLDLILQIITSHGTIGIADLEKKGSVTLLKTYDPYNVLTPGKVITLGEVQSGLN